MNTHVVRNLGALVMMMAWMAFAPPRAGACNVACEQGCVTNENGCIQGCYLGPPNQTQQCISNCQTQYRACVRGCGC